VLDDGAIDLSEQLPGCIRIVASGIFRVSFYTPADVIGDFLVNSSEIVLLTRATPKTTIRNC